MRRPGPLPPSSRATSAPDADEERRIEARLEKMRRLGIDERERETPSADPADAHADTAPLLPLRGASDDASAESDGARATDVEDVEAASWRTVWRAARARRRALRAEVRRFTVRARRRRMAWLAGAGAVLLLVAGSLGAAYSPLLAVETITVEGAEQLDVSAVEASLDGQLGRPLPRVDPSAVKAALVAFPLIETYTIEAHPPHDLVIRIVERTPVGVVEGDAGFTTVDAAGVALATAGERPGGLPLVEVAAGPDSDAFAAVGQVLRTLPEELRARVETARATTPEDVSFTLADGPEIIWGSTDDGVEKLSVLEAAMASEALPEGATVYDVSTPESLIVR